MATSSTSPATLWKGAHNPPSQSAMSGGTSKTDPCRHNTRRPPRSERSVRKTTASPRRREGQREREHTARLHCATRLDTSPPDRPLNFTVCRLHPPLRYNLRLEMGRPTCATNEMDQGFLVPDVPRSKIPPSTRDFRPHHGQPPNPAKADGTSHP